MRLPRFRIRTLMIAVASAAIGFAAAPRAYVVESRAWFGERGPDTIVPYSPIVVIATATVIAAGLYVSLFGILAVLPRVTLRWWLIALAIVAGLLWGSAPLAAAWVNSLGDSVWISFGGINIRLK